MYQNASLVFANTDPLVNYINTHYENVTIVYSTVEEYFAAIHATETPFPVRQHKDFFPLAYDKPTGLQVWSGFYTSRPTLKQYSRQVDNLVLGSQAFLGASILQAATVPQSAIEVLQAASLQSDIILHHDSITGTMCVAEEGCTGGGQTGGDHAVLKDYMRLLSEAAASSVATVGQVQAQFAKALRPVKSHCVHCSYSARVSAPEGIRARRSSAQQTPASRRRYSVAKR